MLGIENPNLVSVEAIKKNFKEDHRNLKGKNDKDCDYFGQSHRKGKRNCPAYGKECDKCGDKNHFKMVCRSDESRRDMRRLDRANGKKSKHRRNVHEIEECHDDNTMEDLTEQVQS